MNKGVKIGIVAALVAAVGVVVYLRTTQRKPGKPPPTKAEQTAGQGLPRLLDLGSKTCLPCTLMAPILDELRKEYAGRMRVEFIDVAETPEAIKTYGIEGIPTQIFYDAAGQERDRHWGFMSKEDILAKWKELGVTFALAAPTTTQPATETVESACPGLASGALTQARLAGLPKGVLVRSSSVTITEADVEKELKAVPPGLREMLARQTFYVAERIVTRPLLLAEGKAAWPAEKPAPSSEEAYINALLKPVIDKVAVTESEVQAFYDRNATLLGGAPLKGVKASIEAYLRREREQAAVQGYIRGIGRRTAVEVSAAWARTQLKAARENPVDEARWSGKRPTLAAFGAAGCCGPDVTQPLVAAVAERLKDRAAVVYVDGRQEFIVSERYGVEAFPTFVIFDAKGTEVARRSGAMSEDALVELVAEAK